MPYQPANSNTKSCEQTKKLVHTQLRELECLAALCPSPAIPPPGGLVVRHVAYRMAGPEELPISRPGGKRGRALNPHKPLRHAMLVHESQALRPVRLLHAQLARRRVKPSPPVRCSPLRLRRSLLRQCCGGFASPSARHALPAYLRSRN